jgi:hypothetical protein
MSRWTNTDFIAFTDDLKLNIGAFIGQIGGNANRLGITILEDSGRVHDTHHVCTVCVLYALSAAM